MTYPPALQALLDACDAVRMPRYDEGSALAGLAERNGTAALARAIDHWRAAKAAPLPELAAVCTCRWTVQGYRGNVLTCRFPHGEREPLVSERKHYPQATLADAQPVVEEWAERAVLAERSNAVNSRLFGSAQRELDAAEERIAQAIKILNDGFKAPEEVRLLALEALRGAL